MACWRTALLVLVFLAIVAGLLGVGGWRGLSQLGLTALEQGVCPAHVPWSARTARGLGRLTGPLARALGFEPPRDEAQDLPASGPSLHPDLESSVVASDLDAPAGLAVLGDDLLLVTEKGTGLVKAVRSGRSRVVPDLSVNAYDERGALGIARHPRFPDEPYVYIFWTWNGRGEPPGDGVDSDDPFDVPRQGNRLDRFRWQDGRLVFERALTAFPSATTVTSGSVRGVHNGGAIAFDRSGMLYAVVGDNHLHGQLQNVATGPTPTDDFFSGVIVRLDDDGGVPADNPFVQAGQALGGAVGRNLQKVFAYGIRNSYGLAVDPLSGTLWMSENGNRLFYELTRVPPGFNSRWVQVMGPDECYEDYRRVEGAGAYPLSPRVALAPNLETALARLQAFPGSRPLPPVFSWRYAVAPTGLAFSRLGGEQLDLFVGDVYGDLYRFPLTADRRDLLLADPSLADRLANNYADRRTAELESVLVGTEFGLISDVEPAPDGGLYVASLSRGVIYRLAPR